MRTMLTVTTAKDSDGQVKRQSRKRHFLKSLFVTESQTI